jgi:hypothetical protein
MPILGYDVFQIPDHETEKAVTDAPGCPRSCRQLRAGLLRHL